jgi:Fe-S cluster assembly protein SufD
MVSKLINLNKIKKDTLQFSLKKNESLTIVLYGSKSLTSHIEISLNGRGAKAYIIGCFVGRAAHTISLTTHQVHTSPETLSDLHIKSVLYDQSKLLYHGSIRIEKDAQMSNAYQRNDNLLLTQGAHVETQPSLEILANDVRCTHGATIGKIDEEQLFYLESRGLAKTQAEELIITGFFESLLTKIDDAKIRADIKKLLITDL